MLCVSVFPQLLLHRSTHVHGKCIVNYAHLCKLPTFVLGKKNTRAALNCGSIILYNLPIDCAININIQTVITVIANLIEGTALLV